MVDASATELHRLGLLTKVDIAPLAAYCHAYGQWRMAAESLAKMQANDPIMNGMIIKTKYGDAALNPLVSHRAQARGRHGALCRRVRPDAGRAQPASAAGITATIRRASLPDSSPVRRTAEGQGVAPQAVIKFIEHLTVPERHGQGKPFKLDAVAEAFHPRHL